MQTPSSFIHGEPSHRSKRAFYSQGGIFLRPDDEGCRQFNQRLRRNKKAVLGFALSLQSRFCMYMYGFLPACISMMERTISFMHDLPDNSLAQRRASLSLTGSGERCTYLVTSTFCSMCTRCSAVRVPYLRAYVL
jgi:hypothetical protein